MIFTKQYYRSLLLIAIGLISLFIGAQGVVAQLTNEWMSAFNMILLLGQMILLLTPIIMGYKEFKKFNGCPSLFEIKPSKETSKSMGLWGSICILGCGVLLGVLGAIDGEYSEAITSFSMFATLAMVIRLTIVGSTYAKVYDESILFPVGSIPVVAIEGYRIQRHTTANQAQLVLQFQIKKHYGLKMWMGALPHLYIDAHNEEQITTFLEEKGVPYKHYM